MRKKLAVLFSLLGICTMLAACAPAEAEQEVAHEPEETIESVVVQGTPEAGNRTMGEVFQTGEYPYDELVDRTLYLDLPVAEGGRVTFRKSEQGWVLEFFFAKLFEEFGEVNQGACIYNEADSELWYHVAITNDSPIARCFIDTQTWQIKESMFLVYEEAELPEHVVTELPEERMLEIGLAFWEMLQQAEARYTELGG